MPDRFLRISRFHGVIRRFSSNRRGSAAIEFALIAPPFFALIFAIIETAMVFFAGQVLETGTQDSARMLFTNQAQSQSWNQAAFQSDLCKRVSVLLDCSKLYTDVQSYASGTPANLSNPINAQGQFVSTGFSYSPPAANSTNIVVVRTYYQWPLFVTGLGYSLANIGSSTKLLAATAAFRVEPNGS